MSEIWKQIKGYSSYQVSSMGQVRNSKTGRILKTQTSRRNGYVYTHLSKNNVVKAYRVHRLVAETFLSGRKDQVNHINGIKNDNRVENLEWVSGSENQLHRYRVLKKDGGRKKIPVRCIETGKVYSCISEATKETKIGHIRQVIAGERSTAGGYRWEKV